MPSQIAECWIKPVTTVQSEIRNICASLSFTEFYYDDAKHLYLPKTLIINIHISPLQPQNFRLFTPLNSILQFDIGHDLSAFGDNCCIKSL